MWDGDELEVKCEDDILSTEQKMQKFFDVEVFCICQEVTDNLLMFLMFL